MLQTINDGAVYAAMDKLLEKDPPPSVSRLRVDTRFAGTRQNPSLRGSITGLDTNNFTPEYLLHGLIEGMAEELYAFYRESNQTRSLLVGAGNGLRKNPALCQALERLFDMPLVIPPNKEEAAHGAAKIAAGNQ